MNYIVYVDSNNRNQSVFPNSNSYTLYFTKPIINVSKVELVSAMFPDVYSSQYLTLDIQELRTPSTLVASALTTADTYETLGNTGAIHNLSVPNSNAFDGSFAIVPVKAATALASNLITFANTSFIYNNEFYSQSYKISVEYPSRIDKIDRLTITWRQTNSGSVFYDSLLNRDLGRNMFILKFDSVQVPEEPERPPSLPDPVPLDNSLEKMKTTIIIAVAILGLLLIIFVRR